MFNQTRIFIFLALTLIACNDQEEHSNSDAVPPLFEFLGPEVTNIDFVNQIGENEKFNILLYENLYNGGGVSVGDINNDGLDDLYFSGNTASNKLYLNQGNFEFKDITDFAGVSGEGGFKTGVSIIDINQDGFLDIYVCRSALASPRMRANVLYINNGDLTFTEMGSVYGIDDESYSAQGYFLDSDLDGDLDLYLINHPNDWKESNAINLMRDNNGELKRALPMGYQYISDRYYENVNGKFVEKSESAGILNNSFSHSAVVADFNEDHLPDLYICNDYIGPDQLLINQGNHTFIDKWTDYFSHTSFSSMGSDYADINNDGGFDLFTLDMSPKNNFRRKMMSMAQNYDKFEVMTQYGFGAQFPINSMQINRGNGKFSDLSFVDLVAQTEWSWSVLLADFDNDGNKDIHITNGYVRDITNNDYRQYEFDGLKRRMAAKELSLLEWIQFIPSDPVRSFLFRNKGELRFEDKSADWNSGPEAFSSGSAYSDLNNDGYIDLVVNNVNAAPFIMKNSGEKNYANHWLSIVFDNESLPFAYGCKAELILDNGASLYESYQPTRGFYSSSQHKLHFGLGADLKPIALEITWPDQTRQRWTDLPLDSILTVSKNPNLAQITGKGRDKKSTYFTQQNNLITEEFSHTENAFIDFKGQLLLHKKLSDQGPAAAVGDVNKDGLEDIYIGGAAYESGRLMIQKPGGRWQKASTVFEADKASEDVDALFFDADGDGDMDLYVVSGGNEFPLNDVRLQDRLYINDGTGNFVRDKKAIPSVYHSGGVVVPFDHDRDGDVDLFVGSYVTPGRYPEMPQSTLLENNNGQFTDQSNNWFSENSSIGMVNDAVFTDLNNDGTPELVLSGEWMPITILGLENGKWADQTASYGLDKNIGWWHSVSAMDVNGDGYQDLIAGNLGLNSIFKASAKEPTTLYYKDFDNNKSIDPILCTYVEGESYPILNRDRLLNHMVFLKKRFTRYAPYARAKIEDIFTEAELKDAGYLEANNFEHTVFINNGKGGFEMQSLPFETQWSVLNTAISWDLDGDGTTEVIVGGNYYGTDAEFSRYDASIGTALKWNGTHFDVIPAKDTGLMLDGNLRHLKPITIDGEQKLLVIRNNEQFSLFGNNKAN